jgi:hypothetical protein
MHLAGRQTGRTVLLTGRVFGGGVRTRLFYRFLGTELGGEGGQLSLKLSELGPELGVLGGEGGVVVLELGVVRDEGKDLHFDELWFWGEWELLRWESRIIQV